MKHGIRPLPPPPRYGIPVRLHPPGIAYVLQIELVRPADNREARAAELRRLGFLIESTGAFQVAKRDGGVVPLNQENGFAVVFFGEKNSPVRCAVQLSTALSKLDEKMTVRIGIATGDVTHTIGGISGVDRVSGEGVDQARQVANLSDPRQILLSAFRDFLKDSKEWQLCVLDLGRVKLKRDISTDLCSLAGEGFGNPARPRNWAFLKAKWWTGKELKWAGAACACVLVASFLMFGKQWISNRLHPIAPVEPTLKPLSGNPPTPSPIVNVCSPGPSRGPVNIEDFGFIASGWMGDAEKKDQGVLKVDKFSEHRPKSPQPHSQKWIYQPKLSHELGWAAVAWQCGENNFGEKPGKDWSRLRLSKVYLWARGVKDDQGILPKLQFKAGGNTNPDRTKYPYEASFEVENDFETLTEDWKPYSIDLGGKDLSQVIAAFIFVIKAQDVGADSATFFLDSITYE